MFTYTVDKELIVHVIKDGNEIDQIGPWDLIDGANGWGTAICALYNDNPSFVYPFAEPVADETETI